MRRSIFALAIGLLAAACTTPNSGRGGGNGGGGGGDGGGIVGGDQCPPEAKLVYVVDENNTFGSFRPDTLTFADVGQLSCPAQRAATPFSMSVDRSATAWVLYSSGQLFTVDVKTLACSATHFAVGQQGFFNFGMGYVSNSPGAMDETLFIAGGVLGPRGGGNATLGTIDVATLTINKLSPIRDWPELTGTGDAKLWGFYPSATAPRVSQIDKASGAESSTFMLADLAGQPNAWAFAFWGGDFWIFLKRQSDPSTNIYHLKQSDGSVTNVIPSSGRHIVGAGVSTCAPVTIS
jgi:hypothetical protein